MERKCYKNLLQWKRSDGRKPLVLRGARQVGKTWLLKDFGKRNFKHLAYFSFDRDDAPKTAFENKNPKRIVEMLEIIAGFKFKGGETFLVLDEIQECPNALGALKYFCEEMPQLHVAAAGSLLGTVLAKPMSYPVGKVNLLDVRPMDFEEFLLATDPSAASMLEKIGLNAPVDDVFHRRLLDSYHKYLAIGGMPECVAKWSLAHDLNSVSRVQKELVAFYEGDFGKHLDGINAMRALQVFRSIVPQLAKENEKFFFGMVKEGARAREFGTAVEWIVSAGIFNRLFNISKPEVPHAAFERMDCFKLFLFDTGLLRCMANVPFEAIFTKKDYQFKGPLIENYVLQQLLCSSCPPPHYYSVKDGHEIDFVMQHSMETVPVEVKGGEAVKSPSLRGYVKNRNPRIAIRFSERGLHMDGPLWSIPLYLAIRITDILDSARELAEKGKT